MTRSILGGLIVLLIAWLVLQFWQPLAMWFGAVMDYLGIGLSVVLLLMMLLLVGLWMQHRM